MYRYNSSYHHTTTTVLNPFWTQVRSWTRANAVPFRAGGQLNAVTITHHDRSLQGTLNIP